MSDLCNIILEETSTKKQLGTIRMETLPSRGETILIRGKDKYYVDHVQHEIIDAPILQRGFETHYRLSVRKV